MKLQENILKEYRSHYQALHKIEHKALTRIREVFEYLSKHLGVEFNFVVRCCDDRVLILSVSNFDTIVGIDVCGDHSFYRVWWAIEDAYHGFPCKFLFLDDRAILDEVVQLIADSRTKREKGSYNLRPVTLLSPLARYRADGLKQGFDI